MKKISFRLGLISAQIFMTSLSHSMFLEESMRWRNKNCNWLRFLLPGQKHRWRNLFSSFEVSEIRLFSRLIWLLLLSPIYLVCRGCVCGMALERKFMCVAINMNIEYDRRSVSIWPPFEYQKCNEISVRSMWRFNDYFIIAIQIS